MESDADKEKQAAAKLENKEDPEVMPFNEHQQVYTFSRVLNSR